MYTLRDSSGELERDYRRLVERLASTLSGGGLVALKSMGGYNLLCDADNAQAVARLRKLKGRYAKPLAVMYRDEATATDDLALTDEQKARVSRYLIPPATDGPPLPLPGRGEKNRRVRESAD